MRPEVVRTIPIDGFQGHSPASLVTITFARGLDTSVLTQNIAILDLTSNALATPYTLSYIPSEYQVGISYPWEPATDYLIQIHRDLQAAVLGTKLGREVQFTFRTEDIDVETAIPLYPPSQVRLETQPVFSWIGPLDATLHDIEVSGSPHFEYVDFATTISEVGGITLSADPISLGSNQTYYWRVRGVGGPWSDQRTFFYGVPQVGIQPLSPFNIVRISPTDMSVWNTVSSITIQLSASPATPSGTTDVYWRTGAVMADAGVAGGPWSGDWSVSGNNLVWTPIFATLATNVRYELYLDEIYDTSGRLLDVPVPVGMAAYAVSGPFSPALANPNELTWAPNPIIAGYYLQVSSTRTLDVAACTSCTPLLRDHAILGARINFVEDQITGWMPEVGRSAKIGDYQKTTDPQAVDGWLKILDQLRTRYDEIESRITDDTGAYVGRRGIAWDSSIDSTDWFSPEHRQGNMTDIVSRGRTYPYLREEW